MMTADAMGTIGSCVMRQYPNVAKLLAAVAVGLALAACKATDAPSAAETAPATATAAGTVPGRAPEIEEHYGYVASRANVAGAWDVAEHAEKEAQAARPGATAREGLQGDVIASTNEPFWHAHVAGPVLRLNGIEAQRELAVSVSSVEGDTRTVRATDAGGAVELEVTATPCQDTMSGAVFPYSAVLVIDGGTPINGCARPASMPPPGKGL